MVMHLQISFLEISLLDEELLASQKGLYSVESMQCVAVNSWWLEWMVVTYTEFLIFRIYDLYVLGKINVFIYSDVSVICQSRYTFCKSRWLSDFIISNDQLFCQNKLQKQTELLWIFIFLMSCLVLGTWVPHLLLSSFWSHCQIM
jgi:hypothetical protein